MDINQIFDKKEPSLIIEELKQRSVTPPDWDELKKAYEPLLHKIVTDKIGRRDKVHNDGTIDMAARIPIGLEKLLVKRVTEFTFATHVKRIYTGTETETGKAIAKAIEAIYNNAHIDTENLKRGTAYYASCEFFTLWYTVKSENTLYGEKSKWKLKCRTYSPMEGCKLYPIFDDDGDLVAMSFQHSEKEANKNVTYFETFTAESRFKWKSINEKWEEVDEPDKVSIMKIPGVFLSRNLPIYSGLESLREDLEYTVSRNSDILAYNAAPILKVAGNIIGEEKKDETRRVYRVEEGGDVSYVSWQQSSQALSYHVDTLLKLYWLQAQMPDISFDTMKGLGNIGYDARKLMFADAHLKIYDEMGPWLECLNREGNVIKAFLKKIFTKWEKEIDNVGIEHIITPFNIEDEAAQIDMHMKANGGKPIESQLESIKRVGISTNAEETLEKIQEEEKNRLAMQAEAQAKGMASILES